MQFRRSGQRDDRRRRVLGDSLLDSERSGGARRAWATGGSCSGRQSKHYLDAVMDEQPRLTDLIPRRLSVFLLLFVLGLAVVAGLEVLYAWMPRLAAMTTDGRVATFDLDGEGSLAVWFSSSVTALAAFVALIIFSVRRYKSDDYHGEYRIWIWAAMCWLLLSVDETASLHEGFKEMMAHVTGTRILGDGSIWWVMPYFFLLGAVGTRLLVDMRRSRLACAAFIGVAACYALAIVAQLGWVMPESGAKGVMLEEGAEMVGNVLLLLAMGLHARFVILDAEGLLPEREVVDEDDYYEEEVDELREEQILASLSQPVIIHPPHGIRKPTRKPITTTVSKTEASIGRRMTTQEKKALKRRLKKMQKQRDAR